MIRYARYLITGAVGPLVASCAQVFTVQPGGNLQHGVVFVLGDVFREHPPPFKITTFQVSERLGNGDELVIWDIHGKQALRSITYRAKYPGLKEVGPTRPLERGKRYSVYSVDSTGRHQLVAFRIDGAGNVIPMPWL